MTRVEVADIFCEYGHLLGDLPEYKRRVVQHIIECRTELLGGHVYKCDKCGHEDHSFHSCRDRHCPKCQYAARKKWVEDRMEEVLAVPYYHVVFTMPHVFNNMLITNKKKIYALLIRTATDTVKKVFSDHYEGAEAGIIAVLHTWGQNLSLHPHVHMVIPSGGLADNDGRWVACRSGKKSKKNYFLPITALSKVFRAKFVKGLKKLFYSGDLSFLDVNKQLDSPGAFQDLIDDSFKTPWVVYAKSPFTTPLSVLKYLGGYTHRIAISNHRIKSVANGMVTFSYKDYREKENDGKSYKKKAMTLTVEEFMRRFLMHVLPRGFARIRYYGFLSSIRKKTALDCARKILAETKKVVITAAALAKTLAEFVTEGFVTSDICPECKEGAMVIIKTILRSGRGEAFLPLRPT